MGTAAFDHVDLRGFAASVRRLRGACYAERVRPGGGSSPAGMA